MEPQFTLGSSYGVRIKRVWQQDRLKILKDMKDKQGWLIFRRSIRVKHSSSVKQVSEKVITGLELMI